MSLRSPVDSSDHIEGLNDAPIELVEYGDYECPYCGQAYPVIKELQKRLGEKLKFVFRNFPLANMHPHALNAAIAAEIAGGFGKFWEMHDLLYENQRELDDQDLINYAVKLGIDEDSFKDEFMNPEYQEKIEKDIESGLRSGVNGTPSFYINGEKYEDDPYDVDAFLEYMKA